MINYSDLFSDEVINRIKSLTARDIDKMIYEIETIPSTCSSIENKNK